MSASDDEDRSDWERCSEWLYKCMVLPKEQYDSVRCVEHLALCLRDGVLLCLLLNRLHPGAIDPKNFSQRPQMSQFLCLKNIRVFIQSCKKVFGMKDSALFDPSDFFDTTEFHKVIGTLSSLSKTKEAKKSGIESFSVENDIYIITPSDSIDEDIYTDHIYGDGTEDADEDVYGQLIDYHPKANARQTTLSQRDYCVKEILDTEKNYVDALSMIVEMFMEPLKNILPVFDSEVIFRHVLDLRTVHRNLLSDLAKANSTPSSRGFSAANTIPGCFVKHKMNLVVYGKYCANLTSAQDRLEQSMKAERVKAVIELKNEEAKVKLRDLLVVPFQRILKYHLLIQQLLKFIEDSSPEQSVLEEALAEMQDLSMYVNEVKRDSENLSLISEIENSIVDLNKYMQDGTRLQDYGRRIFDGQVKLMAPKERNFETRHIFLFDKVMVICRSKSDRYYYKDVIVLYHYNLENHEPDRASKGDNLRELGPIFQLHCFKLVGDSSKSDAAGKTYIGGLKTQDQMQRWWNSIEQAKSNVYPDGYDAGEFHFRLYTFEQPTTCDVCKKLLRGVFYQGYRCNNTGMSVHKECIKKASAMKDIKKGGKVKAMAPYSGQPPPPSRSQRPLTFQYGDVIVVESCSGDWIQGRLGDASGYFPKDKVRVITGQVTQPYEKPVSQRLTPQPPTRQSPNGTPSSVTPSSQRPALPNPRDSRKSAVPRNSESSEIGQPWFAGPMSRQSASAALQDKPIGTFLIRFSPDRNEYALSLRYEGGRDPVKHMKVNKDSTDTRFCLAALVSFENLVQLVEYYKQNSLVESFPHIQTPLIMPYQQASAATAREVEMEPGVMGYCIAMYDYSASEVNQLSFSTDDRIAILNKTCGFPLWWRGRLNGKTGYIPSNYVKEIGGNN